ncbi:trans-Golgi network integral membrane protein 1-like [Palaemon carinicauda]|uniref:trans-Golgi network integral membrane protein 1-like n=1 Tax=Palaemon carinicauda TaxID=392227 RepID=UPI0035B5CD4E
MKILWIVLSVILITVGVLAGPLPKDDLASENADNNTKVVSGNITATDDGSLSTKKNEGIKDSGQQLSKLSGNSNDTSKSVDTKSISPPKPEAESNSEVQSNDSGIKTNTGSTKEPQNSEDNTKTTAKPITVSQSSKAKESDVPQESVTVASKPSSDTKGQETNSASLSKSTEAAISSSDDVKSNTQEKNVSPAFTELKKSETNDSSVDKRPGVKNDSSFAPKEENMSSSGLFIPPIVKEDSDTNDKETITKDSEVQKSSIDPSYAYDDDDSSPIAIKTDHTNPIGQDDVQAYDDNEFESEVTKGVVDGEEDSEKLEQLDHNGQFTTDADSHFFAYFLTIMVTVIIFYLVFHNKQRIIALIIEGRAPRIGRTRRSSSRAKYHKLDNNLEEAIIATKGSKYDRTY